jgi:hypothetical protein
MKKTVVLLFVFVLLASLVGAVSAKKVKTPFTGSGAGYPIVFPECTYPGGNKHCRGMVFIAENDMTDDRLDGSETSTINWNFHPVPTPAELAGPWWGEGQITNAAGDVIWDVQFTGGRDEQGWGHVRYVAHGHGEFEGLKAFFTGVRPSPEGWHPFEFSGYILEKVGD